MDPTDPEHYFKKSIAHTLVPHLKLVPLVALQGEAVLPVGERPDVPLDVVGPADGLHPVDAARVHPDQVARPLQEPVHGDLRLQQVCVRAQGGCYAAFRRKLSNGIAPVFMVSSSYWHIRRKYDALILFSVFSQSMFYPRLFSEISYEKIYISLVFSYLMKMVR
jgi:hypothetical protein